MGCGKCKGDAMEEEVVAEIVNKSGVVTMQ